MLSCSSATLSTLVRKGHSTTCFFAAGAGGFMSLGPGLSCLVFVGVGVGFLGSVSAFRIEEQ